MGAWIRTETFCSNVIFWWPDTFCYQSSYKQCCGSWTIYSESAFQVVLDLVLSNIFWSRTFLLKEPFQVTGLVVVLQNLLLYHVLLAFRNRNLLPVFGSEIAVADPATSFTSLRIRTICFTIWKGFSNEINSGWRWYRYQSICQSYCGHRDIHWSLPVSHPVRGKDSRD